MAVLDVLVFPNPILREETKEVDRFDGDLQTLIADMWETMYCSNGVGLAAPQVGDLRRVVLIDWNGNRYVLVNPEILEEEGEERCEEGCLSFPGIYEEVTRPTKIRVRYRDAEGGEHDEVIEGFLARVFSHEIDHLGGKLLIDHLSSLKRTFLKKKMERRAKSS